MGGRVQKYEYKTDGKFIAGSIENLKQSTILSEYIQKVAEKEANYNGKIDKCKVYKENFFLKYFINGFFISDKIYELEKM